ncbi:hypothetical protein BBC0244_011240 [Bartonella apihabitans]|nr:hypothetical protein [Bartonella apihabitans]AQT44831.1 hypothetical protein BBC0244_011240 [Bartonella apihabitans]
MTIQKQFLLLETSPQIGRPFDDMPELRELLIPFGDSGYVALYFSNSDTIIFGLKPLKKLDIYNNSIYIRQRLRKAKLLEFSI